MNYAYTEGDESFKDGIIINHSVTINGNGHTIDGLGLARIFQITGDHVTLKNINLINGHNYNGGAIYWSGAKGTVKYSNFNNNTATAYGGAIYWNGTNGTLNYTFFNSNSANLYFGGALFWEAVNGTVNNCLFDSNTAGYYGGAVSWNQKDKDWTGQITNSNFINNNATFVDQSNAMVMVL